MLVCRLPVSLPAFLARRLVVLFRRAVRRVSLRRRRNGRCVVRCVVRRASLHRLPPSSRSRPFVVIAFVVGAVLVLPCAAVVVLFVPLHDFYCVDRLIEN